MASNMDSSISRSRRSRKRRSGAPRAISAWLSDQAFSRPIWILRQRVIACCDLLSVANGTKEKAKEGNSYFAVFFFPTFFSGITNGFSSIPFSRATVTAFNALSGCSSCLKKA